MANTITYKPVIVLRQRRADGTWNVKIRVTFKRESRFVATNITAPAKDVDGAGQLRGRTLMKANALVTQFYDLGQQLNYFSLQEMTVDDIVRYIHRRSMGESSGAFTLDFFEFAEQSVLPEKKESTRRTYASALNAFRRFLKGDRLDINDISTKMLRDFAAFLDKEPKVFLSQKEADRKKHGHAKQPGLAASSYIGKLRVIFEAAKEQFNDEDAGIVNIPRSPFEHVQIKCVHTPRRTALPPESIQRLISDRGVCRPNHELALDIYLLSFALMGMNAIDMFHAVPPKKNVLVYERIKTRDRRPDRAEQHVFVDPRIRKLAAKYKDPTGKRLFNFYLNWRSPEEMCRYLRYSYYSWADANGERRFTFYSARHSFATIARSSRVGIDKATVDECLTHISPDMRMADVYIEKDWQIHFDAARKVLDLFDWSALQ